MTRAIHGFGWSVRRTHTVQTEMSIKQQMAAAVFVVLLLLSAFSVIYLKDLSRRLYIQYQQLQFTQQESEMKWSKLLLEKGAWSTQARVQHIAATELNMTVPKANEVVLVEQ